MSYERGNERFADGAYEDAVREYRAAIAEGEDRDDPDLYENLGVALWKLGRWRSAARCLLRTLDGDLTSREQALRLLVSCAFRAGLANDGERFLRLYEARFGPHPEAWTPR